LWICKTDFIVVHGISKTLELILLLVCIHIVYGARLVTVAGVCLLSSSSSSSETLPVGGWARRPLGVRAVGQLTLHGGPVVLRPVKVVLSKISFNVQLFLYCEV